MLYIIKCSHKLLTFAIFPFWFEILKFEIFHFHDRTGQAREIKNHNETVVC